MVAVSAGRTQRAFVLAAVGERHVARLSTTLTYLKRFSRAEIVVLQARSHTRAAHDQLIEVDLPDHLDDHQASIALKTNLLTHLDGFAQRYCYLDSDVIAVRGDVDRIFDQFLAPIRFAEDHTDIDAFSRWAVRCGCTGSCHHLREALLCSFAVDVRQCSWIPWNGGVFLFGDESAEFLDVWNRVAVQTFADPYWRTRDQAALAAAAWRLGLELHSPLPREFNFIVDRLWEVPANARPTAIAPDFYVGDDYALDDEPGRAQPRLIHFVNEGVGQRGWAPWDEVEALIPHARVKGPEGRGA
jgi:hypothetical protein